jgi:predicted nuclease of predicted toxin-antitoxin system
LRLLLDENCASRALQLLLRNEGHDVETAIGALGPGVSDAAVVAYACSQRRVLISKDTADFSRLYAGRDGHRGLLLIFEDATSRRLNAETIVRAIHNIEVLYAVVDGMIVALTEFQS